MTDHKFTDEENILFLLKTSDDIYANVKLSPEEAKILLALINRQKAEIERLRKYNTDVAFKHYNDGIKEFAERLKIILDGKSSGYLFIPEIHFDNLVKEMTEGKND